jgi:hypothetical protein
MEALHSHGVVYYIPSIIRTLVLVTCSNNVRILFLLVKRFNDYFAYASIDRISVLPCGATQICLAALQSEFYIYVRFHPYVVERLNLRIVPSNFFPSHTLLLYLISYNIFIDRPLSLYSQCIARAFLMGYNYWNVGPEDLPFTVRSQLFFPIRRSLRYRDSNGDIVYTCTSCEIEAYDF